MALSNRQQVFISEYLICWNSSEAARRAGYKGEPSVMGARQLGNVSVAAAIRQRLDAIAMSADEALVRLTEHGRGDMADFIDIHPGGGWSLGLEKALATGKTRLIKKIRKTENGPEIELYSAQEALVQLGRARGLFGKTAAGTEDDPQHVITHTAKEWKEEAARRLAQAQETAAAFEDDAGEDSDV